LISQRGLVASAPPSAWSCSACTSHDHTIECFSINALKLKHFRFWSTTYCQVNVTKGDKILCFDVIDHTQREA